MKITHGLLSAVLGAAVLQAGCGGGSTNQNCESGKCDGVPDAGAVASTPCDGVVVDHSGNDVANVARTLDDPFANNVLKAGDSCPTTFQGIMAKLREFDTSGCEGETDGLTTRVVSETAQVAGQPTSFRAVTSRQCDGRPSHGLIFSLFGLRLDRPLPSTVEIIAFDEAQGVFNYYKTDGDRINFFGNSVDMLRGPAGEDRECAACHTGGGLIMKELDIPWVHWEGHMDTPGAAELVAAHTELGSKSEGANMEGLTSGGNRAWNATRAQHLRQNGTVADMLEPLFCSVEVNLDNGADFESPVEGGRGGSEVSEVPFDALLDPRVATSGFGGVAIDFADYDAAIKAMDQRIAGIDGAIDTVFDLTFVERARADDDYVEQLADAQIISPEFARDVLMVDFTRPVFSDDRCGLVTFAPELAPEERTPQAIRDGFVSSLQSASPAAGSPGAELLANLQNDGLDHDALVDGFIGACEGLTQTTTDLNGAEISTFVANVMQVVSLNRELATSLTVFEFPQTMPQDGLRVPAGTRLHPETCELTTEFVPVASGG